MKKIIIMKKMAVVIIGLTAALTVNAKLITFINNEPGKLVYVINNKAKGTSTLHVTNMKIIGKINSEDLSLIHTMCTEWVLDTLDLSEVRIVGSEQQRSGSGVMRSKKVKSDEIDNSMFSQTHLKWISLPATTKRIGEEAFEFCEELRTVVIPNSVKEIGKRAFAYCKKLTDITLPRDLTAIPDALFYDCESLPKLTIPQNVETIGDNAFAVCKAIPSVVIPDRVKTIGYSAFSAMQSVKSIVIGKGVEYIDTYAFFDNPHLEKLVMSPSIKTMKNGVFSTCPSLKEVDFCAQLDSLPAYTFYKNTSLQKVILPPTIKVIDDNAFRECTALKGIYIQSLDQWLKMKFVNDRIWNVTSNPLQYAHNLYVNNKLVTDFVFPEGTTAVPDALLFGSSVKSITLPQTLKYIGLLAFYGCRNLKSIYYYGTKPAACADGNVFKQVPQSNCTVYLLPGVEKFPFLLNFNWSNFQYDYMKVTAVDKVQADDGVSKFPIYDIDGRYRGDDATKLHKGLYISNGKKFLKR